MKSLTRKCVLLVFSLFLVGWIHGVQSPPLTYFNATGATYPFYPYPTFPHAAYSTSSASKLFVWESWDANAGKRSFMYLRWRDGSASPDTPVFVGYSEILNDDHGNPCLAEDYQNYKHVFGGPHGFGPLRHWSSPDGVTWTAQDDVGSNLSYCSPIALGSSLYLLSRNTYGSNDSPTVYFKTTSLNNGVAVWTAQQSLVDFGNSSRAYFVAPQLRNSTEIHWAGLYANGVNSIHSNLYYFILDTTTGDVKNYDGSVTTAAASLPISLATANASYRIATQPNTTGGTMSLAFDNAGNKHALFSDTAGLMTDPQALYYLADFGSGWTTPLQIGTIASGNSDAALIPASDGGMDVYFPVTAAVGAFPDGGDINTRHRTVGAGGTWNSATLLQAAVAGRALNAISPVLPASNDARVIFSETLQSSADTTPGIGTLKMWAYSRNTGYLIRPNINFVLKRDLDPAANDNSPMWLEKAA